MDGIPPEVIIVRLQFICDALKYFDFSAVKKAGKTGFNPGSHVALESLKPKYLASVRRTIPCQRVPMTSVDNTCILRDHTSL